MVELSSKQVVLDAWKVFGTRDAQQIAAAFAEGAEWIAPQGNATAVALDGPSHIVGREAIVRFIAQDFHTLFVSDVSAEIRGVFEDGNTVVIEQRMRATLASGRKYDNDYCFLIVVKSGRIAQVREYMDTQRGKQCIFG